MKTINAEDLHAKDMADPVYRKAYESFEGEFERINALLRARAHAGISKAEITSNMGTLVNTIKWPSSATNRKNER